MQFVLTPSPNVTAERVRLRVLRDQIAANVAARKEHDRKFTPRGFAWIDHEELRQLRELAAQGVGSNRSAPAGEMRARPGMGVPAAAANLPATCANTARTSPGASSMAGEGVGQ